MNSMSGEQTLYLNGWITTIFAFEHVAKKPSEPTQKRFFDRFRKKKPEPTTPKGTVLRQAFDWYAAFEGSDRGKKYVGLSPDALSSHLCKVPMRWRVADLQGGVDELDTCLVGGILSSEEDAGFIRPRLGFGIKVLDSNS